VTFATTINSTSYQFQVCRFLVCVDFEMSELTQ